MSSRTTMLESTLRRTLLLPVITLEEEESAVPLGEAVLEGGLGVIEITMRTPAALGAVERLASALPELVVGVGTVRRAEDLDAAAAAGASFAVSPGWTETLGRATASRTLPVIPGVATASEAMAAAEQGFRLLKFFPAASAGGCATLKAWGSALPDLVFCPTGGIDGNSAVDYLSLGNVVCVGGSWMVPPRALRSHDWRGLTGAVSRAVAGVRSVTGDGGEGSDAQALGGENETDDDGNEEERKRT